MRCSIFIWRKLFRCNFKWMLAILSFFFVRSFVRAFSVWGESNAFMIHDYIHFIFGYTKCQPQWHIVVAIAGNNQLEYIGVCARSDLLMSSPSNHICRGGHRSVIEVDPHRWKHRRGTERAQKGHRRGTEVKWIWAKRQKNGIIRRYHTRNQKLWQFKRNAPFCSK